MADRATRGRQVRDTYRHARKMLVRESVKAGVIGEGGQSVIPYWVVRDLRDAAVDLAEFVVETDG